MTNHYQIVLKCAIMARFFISFDYNFHQFRLQNRAQEYFKSVVNILYVTEFVMSWFAVFEAAIMVTSTHLINLHLETRKKEKIWK